MAERIEQRICLAVDEIVANLHGEEDGHRVASCTLSAWPLVTQEWMDETRAGEKHAMEETAVNYGRRR